MAIKKKPAAAPVAKAAKATSRAAAPAAPVPQPGNTQRLLREAAWSRMFGRTESKNPFAR